MAPGGLAEAQQVSATQQSHIQLGQHFSFKFVAHIITVAVLADDKWIAPRAAPTAKHGVGNLLRGGLVAIQDFRHRRYHSVA